ncbi:MAG: hypothetical protein JNM39_02155 [Bdellovibrionaceae bacterium]|nr:hypothetical protein [Pseudobdellovibrionaceae bacterium]
MRYFLVLSLFFCQHQLAFGGPCENPNHSMSGLASFKQFGKFNCQETKDSELCQEFYRQSNIDDSLGAPLQLDCNGLESESAGAGWSLGYCFAGVGRPIVDQGIAMIDFLTETRRRQIECDSNSEIKKGLYVIHNEGVPELLRLKVPSDEYLNNTSCAQLENNLSIEIREKARRTSEKYDHLLVRGPRAKVSKIASENSDTVNKYLEWKASRMFAAPDFAISMDFFDEIFRQFEIRKQCLHPLALSALRCDIAYQVATLGFTRSRGGIEGLFKGIPSLLKNKRLLLRKKIEGELFRDGSISTVKPQMPEYSDVPVLTARVGDFPVPGWGSGNLAYKVKGNSTTGPLILTIEGRQYPVSMKLFEVNPAEHSGAIVYVLDGKGKVIFAGVPAGRESTYPELLELARRMRDGGELP